MRLFASLAVIALSASLNGLQAREPDFPKQLAGMEMVKVTDYEKQQPGLGGGWSYRAETVKADVYIYSAGLRVVPSDLDATVITRHFQEVAGELRVMETKGYYSDVTTVIQGQKIKIGDLPVWHSEMTFTFEGIPRISHIYLGVWDDKFFKIRFTYFAAERANGEKALTEFLAGIGKLL